MKRPTLIITALCAFLLAGSVCYANIYGYQDERGVFHFTNVQPAQKKYRTVVFSGKQASGLAGSRQVFGQSRKELITHAMSYLGTPYKLGGNFSTGIDCSGFVKQVYSAFEVKLPRTAREQFHEGTRVDRESLTAGDLIFFRSEKSGDPAHVGIFMDEDRFIHATTRNGGGVRIDSLADHYYRRTFMGASRVMQ
jgi:cell wall-associated NlpC family hydrolase